MADISVKIKADDSDLKAAFQESSTEARKFSESVKEQFAELKDMTAEIAGESGFGGVKKVLTGLGTVAFGTAVVEEFKKAGEAAIDWEKQVTALKFSLPAAFSGMAESIQEWVESVSGGMGHIDADMRVMQALLQSGMGVDEAKAALVDLQNAAAKTGINFEELGLKFAEIKSLNEVPERFWKEFPALKPIARGLGMPEHPAADWMLKTLLPNIAPGGLQSPVRLETEATAAAQMADLGVKFENLAQTVGIELLPTLKDFLAELKKDMPAIAESLKAFAEQMGHFLQAMGGVAKAGMGFFGASAFKPSEGPPGLLAIQGGQRPNIDWLNATWGEMVSEFREATKEHSKNASLWDRALHPR